MIEADRQPSSPQDTLLLAVEAKITQLAVVKALTDVEDEHLTREILRDYPEKIQHVIEGMERDTALQLRMDPVNLSFLDARQAIFSLLFSATASEPTSISFTLFKDGVPWHLPEDDIALGDDSETQLTLFFVDGMVPFVVSDAQLMTAPKIYGPRGDVRNYLAWLVDSGDEPRFLTEEQCLEFAVAVNDFEMAG